MVAHLTWPDEPLPDVLDDRPALVVTVTTPYDQAELHRTLARLGYVADVIVEGVDEGIDQDVYQFAHPDGEQP